MRRFAKLRYSFLGLSLAFLLHLVFFSPSVASSEFGLLSLFSTFLTILTLYKIWPSLLLLGNAFGIFLILTREKSQPWKKKVLLILGNVILSPLFLLVIALGYIIFGELIHVLYFYVCPLLPPSIPNIFSGGMCPQTPLELLAI